MSLFRPGASEPQAAVPHAFLPAPPSRCGVTSKGSELTDLPLDADKKDPGPALVHPKFCRDSEGEIEIKQGIPVDTLIRVPTRSHQALSVSLQPTFPAVFGADVVFPA